MLIARANPWFCLGLAFLWLALSAVAPARPDALPAVSQIVFSSLILYALLLSATFFTAATVPPEESERRVHPAIRALRVVSADVLKPLWGGRILRTLAVGFATGLAVVALSLCVSALVGLLSEAVGREMELQTVVDLFLRSAWPGRTALIVSVVLLTPVVEELFFRYALESVLAGALRSRTKALAYGAVLFAAMHGNLAAFPSLLVVSAGCSLAYCHAGSLLAPIAAHFFFNLVSVSLLLAGVAG